MSAWLESGTGPTVTPSTIHRESALLAEIEKLLELQELEIVRKESRIVHGESPTSESVGNKIETMRAGINKDVLSRYDRISVHGPGVVRIHKHGMCLGCNLAIPQGDLNRMTTGKTEPVCPHCGRFLSLLEI